MRRLLFAGLLCCGAAAALAEGEFLPGELQVLDAIDAMPAVQAALAREDEADARNLALARGPYGIDVSVAPTVRHENRGTSYGEWEASISRRLRLPRKAALDRQLGEIGREASSLGLADARHAGALTLLDQWFAWLRAAGALKLAHTQLEVARSERAAIARSVAAGELATLDAERADAAQAQSEAALARAEFETTRARAALDAQFPALTPGLALPPVPTPRLDGDGSEQDIVAGMLHDNHELAIAEAQARRQGLAAARADAERRPDPSVGLRVIDEARGNEQAIGLVVSIPFAGGGAAPTALAEQHLAQAMAADAAEVRNLIHSEARQLASGITAQLASWRAADRARVANDAALARIEKARALGEAGFADLALARRNAQDARAGEWQARLDVHETRLRIEINSHRMWARHDEHDH